MEEQSTKLAQICQWLLKQEDLLLFLDYVKEGVRVDSTLKGVEMREDRYLKACLREGVDLVMEQMQINSVLVDD